MFLACVQILKLKKKTNWKYKFSANKTKNQKNKTQKKPFLLGSTLSSEKQEAFHIHFPFPRRCQVIDLPWPSSAGVSPRLQTICGFPLSPEQNADFWA